MHVFVSKLIAMQTLNYACWNYNNRSDDIPHGVKFASMIYKFTIGTISKLIHCPPPPPISLYMFHVTVFQYWKWFEVCIWDECFDSVYIGDIPAFCIAWPPRDRVLKCITNEPLSSKGKDFNHLHHPGVRKSECIFTFPWIDSARQLLIQLWLTSNNLSIRK